MLRRERPGSALMSASLASRSRCPESGLSRQGSGLAASLAPIVDGSTKTGQGHLTAYCCSRRPRHSRHQLTQEELAHQETIFMRRHLPFNLVMRARSPCLLSIISSTTSLLACCQLVAYPVGRPKYSEKRQHS